METAAVSAVLNTLAPKIFSFLQENHNMRRDLERDIKFIRKELRMIAASIEDHDRRSWNDGASDVQRLWAEDVRDLAYCIEDSIDRFLHRVTDESDASSLHRRCHRTKTMAIRTKFAAEIRELRKRSEEASKLREKYTAGFKGASASTTFSASSGTDTPAADLVGMDVPRDELLELIREAEDHPRQLKVISIVGFGGLGKTALARHVYNSIAAGEKQYEPQVWVRAADKDARDVLKEILQQVQAGMQVCDVNCDFSNIITSLRNFLLSKRFFIVIDDMRTEFWNIIKNAFPAPMGVSSRLMVTTAIQSVAIACSSVNGHVYIMRTLDDEHSRRLFLREASLDFYEPAAEPVLKKCGGLPLALGTTAQFLQSKRQLTLKGYADLCRRLGEHVEKEETLARMKHVLLHNYTSLPGQVIKACLLYFGVFPSGHPVRRKCLIRRWLAEGFLEADYRRSALDVAIDNFEDLMNRNIIQPVDMSNNTVVKTCQTHSMMLEFIQYKSICENFITLLHDQARLPEKIRRLSIHRNTETKVRTNSDIDLSLVRSLTVFGKADKNVLKFRKYELLRVLDLEECEALNDEHVKKICNLLLLRYLSLGGQITLIPREISKLKFLETLDVRRAKIEILPLPIEVIKLPCLLHLLGVFRFPDVVQQISKLRIFLSEKSNMETLAEVVADNSLAFPQLMGYMNSLKKIKVRCESASGSNFTHLSRPIQEFIQRGADVNDARSLSVDFEGCSHDFLDFPLNDEPCYLSSLKLQGKLCKLPPFVTNLTSITELCLSSSDQLGSDVLAALSNVCSLHCLKLIASHLNKFVIEQGALRSLQHLCIVVGSMTCLENQEGALPNLESLWLLCKGLSGLGGTRIEWLTRLKEVSLDDGVSNKTRTEWNLAAKNHPRRPRVSLLKANKDVDPMQIGGGPEEICENPVATTSQAAGIQMQNNKEYDPSAVYEKSAGKLANLWNAKELLLGKRKAIELSSNKRKANESTSTEIKCAANGYFNMSRRLRGGGSSASF